MTLKYLIYPLAVNISGFKHAVITVICYELATITGEKEKGWAGHSSTTVALPTLLSHLPYSSQDLCLTICMVYAGFAFQRILSPLPARWFTV